GAGASSNADAGGVLATDRPDHHGRLSDGPGDRHHISEQGRIGSPESPPKKAALLANKRTNRYRGPGNGSTHAGSKRDELSDRREAIGRYRRNDTRRHSCLAHRPSHPDSAVSALQHSFRLDGTDAADRRL